MSALGVQNLTVGSFNRHLEDRRRRKKSRRRLMIAGLTLTSMVDMFSLLVIFLLQTFSASPELVMVNKGVTLPSAISGQALEDASVLAVSNEEVYLDQKLVGKTQSLLQDPTPLMEKLQDLRETWQSSHPDKKFAGIINIQADKDLPSTIVSQLMGLLPTQAYSTVQLAVVIGGGS